MKMTVEIVKEIIKMFLARGGGKPMFSFINEIDKLLEEGKITEEQHKESIREFYRSLNGETEHEQFERWLDD